MNGSGTEMMQDRIVVLFIDCVYVFLHVNT